MTDLGESEIGFGADEECPGARHFGLDFGIPLYPPKDTLFLALTKDSCYATENAIKKISVLG